MSNLTAAPGHNKINLNWSNPTGDPNLDTYGILIRRGGWGDYPEYSVAAPSYPDTATGTRVLHAAGMPTSYLDTTFPGHWSGRDIYYYQAFVFDKAYNYGGGGGGACDRATSYWLGDVDPKTPSVSIGDGSVQFSYDVTDLSATYHQPEGGTYWNAHCDVGPTDDASRLGIPQPDNQVEFEDLMIFSMNYGVVAPLVGTVPGSLAAAVPGLELRVPATPAMGIVTATLVLSRNPGVVKGLHSRIGYDRSRLELLGVEKGALAEPAGVFFAAVPQSDGVIVDVAQLGEGLAFAGSGEVAVLRFRVRSLNGRPELVEADLRNAANRDPRRVTPEEPGLAESAAAVKVQLPITAEFRGALPNPFRGQTDLLFALPAEASVMLRIYDVGGRLVRTLADTVFPAGEHRIRWDGRSDEARQLGGGVYFAEFRCGQDRTIQRVLLVR